MGEKRGEWVRISSTLVHKNPYYCVREDRVIKPDGSNGFYNVVQIQGAVFAVALDEQENIYLVGLHRYPNNNYSIEVPSGGSDGQEPLVAAKRELQEETGLTAKKWQQLNTLHPANGVIQGNHYTFIATELKQTTKNHKEEEGISEVLKVPLNKAFKMINNKQITDADSIASLTLAGLELGFIK